MYGKIIINITDGVLKGQKYEYTEPGSFFIGRQNDCDIVLPEKTVSNHHCIMSINPPTIRIKDYGSLNGTYINGKKIGQRDRDKSCEEAKNKDYPEFDLHDGDLIRLGKRCELKCSIKGKTCNYCGKKFIPKMRGDALCPECQLKHDEKIKDIWEENFGERPLPVEGYEKIELLGKGGMGEVWKVKEKKSGQFFALKIMNPRVATDEKSKRMFLREISLCEQIDHKNVVRTYKTGCANGVFYILMDLCQGGSAEELMKKNKGKLSLNMATYIILQALTGLEYVHNLDVNVEIREKDDTKTIKAHGIVHRDFKPGNILLSDRGDHPVAMVADFGISKAFETAGMSGISGEDQKGGTCYFMPRQQVRDYRFSKPEVDVWAAAASYYYMLTGQQPKNLKSNSLMWLSLAQEAAVPILKRDPSIPPRIASVIDQALVEEPEIYYKSANAFRRDIIEALPPETRAYCKGVL